MWAMIIAAKIETKETWMETNEYSVSVKYVEKKSVNDINPTTISICGNGANTGQLQNGQH